ncbi:hypothetical protein [Paenibacillus sp. FJAT-27812]|uniref:hypothetical protein n=1 Tax=Paenibacillus sp. FJAT-27812 TaxID=1684143 RepID=UPI0006A7AF23|nr:hypothetical protein [Paenibacillus sp. FJAT-27812]
MTNAESIRSEQPIDQLLKQPIVLLHELNAVSDSVTSSIIGSGDAMDHDACLSTALVCIKPNKNVAANSLDVQVFAAMKKA